MNSCIIVSAGSGSRMESNTPKQYLNLNGIPVFIYSIKKFQNHMDEIILVIKEEDEDFVSLELEKQGISGIKLAFGGKTRQDSVYNGLKAVKGDIVLVHDAARPMVSDEIIVNVIESAKEVGSCVAAVALKDTVKQVNKSGDVKTLNREDLFTVQTPQGFSYEFLKRAYDKAYEDGYIGTDDSSLTERLGIPTKLVSGSYRNIKITTPEDFILAEYFILA